MVNYFKETRIFRLFALLWRGYGVYKWQLLLIIILGFGSGILEGIGINAVIPLFSFVTGSSNYGTDVISNFIQSVFGFLNIKFSFRYLLVFIFILFIARAVVTFINNYIKIKVGTDYSLKARISLFSKMVGSGWPYLLKQKLGHLETILMTNVPYGESLLYSVSSIAMVITGLLMYLLVAINISLPITAFTIGLGVIIFFVFKPILDKTRGFSGKLELLNRDISHFVNEHVSGMKTVKAMLAGNQVIEKGKGYFKSLRKLRFKIFLLGIIPDSLLQPIGLMFVLVIFAFSYKTPNFNIAALAAVVYLIEKIFVYVQQLQKYFQTVSEYAPYLQTIIKYEDESVFNQEIDNGLKNLEFKDKIEFKKVSFVYNKGEANVFDDLSFEIKQGEMVGVVGQSGVGKTTIVDLLLRFFRPSSGEILVDGENVEAISLNNWRNNIGYISQDIFLLNDTIANNIRFYDPKISDQAIEQASRMANIYDFIISSPDKFETIIGERGVMLSGGQRQRIIIARILARNPKLLILDEATSSLDNKSEQEIQSVIDKLKGKITVIIIAHRLSTVLNADKIILVDKGRIIEMGDPKVLLDNPNSDFNKLYNIKT